MQQASAERPRVSQSRQPVPTSARKSGAELAWIGRGFLLILAAVVALILARNLLDNPRLFAQIVISGLQLGFVYALIALGYTMVYGIVRLINFAHGDVFMVGSFVSFFAVSRFSLHTWPEIAFPGLSPDLVTLIGAISVILLSMIVCAILAVVIERVAYKPLRNAPRITALITAIGVSFFLEFFGALNFVFSPRFIPYQRPFDVYAYYVGGSGIGMVTPNNPAPPDSITFSSIFVIIVIASILMQVLLQWLVKQTKMGKAMRASAVDKPTTRLMGVNVDRVISFTFAIGAAFAGRAGVLFAIAYPSIHTQLGILPGLKAFVAAVLGGIGSIPGALVGALIMGQAESLTAGYISTPMRDAVAFTILIIVLLVRPTGIFGEPTGEKA